MKIMKYIYKIRSILVAEVIAFREFIKIAIYVVLIAILFEVIGIATAHADEYDDFFQMDLFTGYEENNEPMPRYGDVTVTGGATGFHDKPYSIDNSQYNLKHSPYSIRNSEFNLRNSRYSHGNNIIRDNSGRAIGYSVPREDGGVNFFGYDGAGRIGYIPAPR